MNGYQLHRGHYALAGYAVLLLAVVGVVAINVRVGR